MKNLTEEEVRKIRSEFPIFKKHEKDSKGFCYLDNGATTFKPNRVLKKALSYYEEFDANTHRGDYPIANKADEEYSKAREEVASFINSLPEEVIFTSGCTMGLNAIALMLTDYIQPGDEIILNLAEHASNILPWYALARRTSAKIVFAPINEKGEVTIESLKSVLTSKTKIVSMAEVTNVLGSVQPVKEAAVLVHNLDGLMIVDGAQSVPHRVTDVKDLNCDFLVFSGHKMYAPNGIGVLYGKKEILEKLPPFFLGGGMNARFYPDLTWTYEDVPYKFEAGTQNPAGAIALAEACRFLKEIGLEAIGEWELNLKQRAVEALKSIPDIEIYNSDSPSGILSFNVKGVMAQDEGTLLGSKGVFVRSGLHCAKMLDKVPPSGTVRASFAVYNTLEDCDKLITCLQEGGDILDAYFS